MTGLPALPAKTSKTPRDKDFSDIIEMLRSGKELIINDRYQRGEIGSYKPQFRTRLIESIIRGFPLPPLLVMERSDGSPDELLDGQQRVRTVQAYMNGEFALDGDHLLMLDSEAYDGLRWDDLDAAHQKRIRRGYTVKMEYIDESMPPHIVYVLINGGVNPMTQAELRKAMFAEEEGFWKVHEYAKEENWTRNLSKAYINREKGTETAFKALLSIRYGDNLDNLTQSKWLESHMEQMFSELSVAEVEKSLKHLNQVIKTARQVFGNRPFGTPEGAKVKNPCIYMVSYALSKAIKKYRQVAIESNATLVRDLFYEFYDNKIGSAHTYGVTGTDVSQRNRELWNLLDAMMSTVSKSKIRPKEDLISEELRNKVIDSARADDGTVSCGICGEVFRDEGQITIDHDDAWINGGETTLENLQPAHGSCNSSKRDKVHKEVLITEG